LLSAQNLLRLIHRLAILYALAVALAGVLNECSLGYGLSRLVNMAR
jgi:hypothetical protein